MQCTLIWKQVPLGISTSVHLSVHRYCRTGKGGERVKSSLQLFEVFGYLKKMNKGMH